MNEREWDICTKINAAGMNYYQSKVLSVLITGKEMDAKEIADTTVIPYTKIYEILLGLEERSFIISDQSRPKKFKVTNLKFIIESMLSREKEKYQEAKLNIKKILKAVNSEGTK